MLDLGAKMSPALGSSGLVAQSCPTLCDPLDCIPPGSSVHGMLQVRILEWDFSPLPSLLHGRSSSLSTELLRKPSRTPESSKKVLQRDQG